MKINLFVIRSAISKELAEFYELLNITFDYHQHGNGPFHYSTIIDQTVFEIYPTKKSGGNTVGVRLGFEIEGIEIILNRIEKSCGKIIKPPFDSEYGRIAVIQDPEGRKIELKELVNP